MLPATVQFFIAMIASALTDRLTRKMDYMLAEQWILIELMQQATGKKRGRILLFPTGGRNTMNAVTSQLLITGGVDTHKDTHRGVLCMPWRHQAWSPLRWWCNDWRSTASPILRGKGMR